MNKNSKIYIAGSTGLAGSAIFRKLISLGYTDLLTQKTDLTNKEDTNNFFKTHKPEYVFLCAAKVGGIIANKTYPADFISINLSIQQNVIENSYKYKVKKMLLLGSSCIYPKNCPQPILEEYLLTGPLEETNRAYAIAKIAGIELLNSYRKQYGFNGISLMPTNLLGIGDNYNLETSHVLPALIRKFHEAKINNTDVVCWGTGNVYREFLCSDDLADASEFLMRNYDSGEVINVGYGSDITIKELSIKIANIIGFKGNIIWDNTKPDGTYKKLLDSSKLFNMGWKPKISLDQGIELAYNDFKQNPQLRL